MPATTSGQQLLDKAKNEVKKKKKSVKKVAKPKKEAVPPKPTTYLDIYGCTILSSSDSNPNG